MPTRPIKNSSKAEAVSAPSSAAGSATAQPQDMRITGLPVTRWLGAVHGLKQALGAGRCPPMLAPAARDLLAPQRGRD